MMRALAIVPLLALVLVGCSSTTPTAAPTTVTVAATPSAAPATTAPTPSSQAPTPTPSPQAAAPCELPDLGVELSRAADSGTQQAVRVVWTDTSGKPCTMRGFGGVDLQRTPSSHAALPVGQRSRPDRFSAARTDRQPEPVRLEPGGHAHTTITYVPVEGGDPDAFVPSQVLATPPDETRSAVLSWPGGGVLDANPGAAGTTYIDPVRPGAS